MREENAKKRKNKKGNGEKKPKKMEIVWKNKFDRKTNKNLRKKTTSVLYSNNLN